ncbi:mandelate racemase/muconate lactonizing enzyme family protein [Tuwongella immobilis]|uniref:Mandelate racemase/muconate lactonizing enzyme C-terminal domain-containing protein n=1 Tax=Tuwongella immobilis TaxID=692036 RepID=A0A6C2YWB0_9BACT|nr:enolase C-terminal domain-like protein [Tuwongella immobilis]VIP05239.1 mandelate racemase : Mandelate racemase/muconate lactonizing protein OS=Pedosphaera parvula (strain Ellin514) GN=Cflav_PD4472 PE=4 SV=1: MR_MLE_N: MR_MLE_C [Tuwongella immobilis]VTS07834.1 mandelate racemase : Mandelate racemase/muconate lactonizing protein OS=Pedosphaera parvula (strain Ellin514) GN=Cflav_PD4472 PE=4 SV=1: MR_MLE_N: MR_MLE_C [Tuwongella immobilis]
MRITHVETIPVHVPIRAGMTMKTAHGEHVDSEYVLVRLHTESGLVGLGEATVGPRWNGENFRGCEAVIRDFLAPVVVGADLFQRNTIRRAMDDAIKLHPFAKSAIEMALWDLAGKALGVPVYQLLGGKVRERIPIKMVIGAFPVPKAVALAKQFLDSGVPVLKVKVGLDPEMDYQRVKAIRELAGPNVPIGVDANGGWDVGTARRMMERMQALDLLFIEQPIPPGDPAALAQVRALSRGVPIMADESAFTLTDAWTVARQHAADVIAVYPGKNGGISNALEVVNLAKSAGLVCHMGSNLELGIATAAMIHLAAATPEIACERFPADILGPLYHEFDVIREPLQLGPVFAEIPQAPGLGVELDEAILAKCRC